MKRLAFVLIAGSLALVTVNAQQHDHAAPAKPAASASTAKPAAAAEHKPEVFCGTMKTGQLCSNGTVTLLGLTPEKREEWIAAVRAYNKVVNEATVALQGKAKNTLSAAQAEEVNRWFAIGVNPQINQLLLADANAKAAAK